MHRFIIDYGDHSPTANIKITEWAKTEHLREATVDEMIINKLNGSRKRLYNLSVGASKGYVIRISHETVAVMFKLKFQNRIWVDDDGDD